MPRNQLLALKALFTFMSLAMAYLAIKTSLQSNLFEVWPALSAQPWFTATLVDFYFNTAIISAWVIYKEKHLMAALAWIVLFICLGSIATSLYVLIQLWKLKANEPLAKVLVRDA